MKLVTKYEIHLSTGETLRHECSGEPIHDETDQKNRDLLQNFDRLEYLRITVRGERLYVNPAFVVWVVYETEDVDG